MTRKHAQSSRMFAAFAYAAVVLLGALIGHNAPVAHAEETQVALAYAIGLGGSGADVAYSVTYDSDRNVYVAGIFTGTIDFNPGSSTDEKTSVGDNDIFLTKINADGSYGYTKTMGGISTDNARSITVDSSDNVYVTGQFAGIVDFDPGVAVDNHTANNNDIFLTKINADGSYGYTKTMGGDAVAYAYGVATDRYENVYVTGAFWGTVDFDPSAGTDEHTSADESLDIYVTKINADGSYGWTQSIGADENDYGYGLAVDDDDTIYVVGQFGGTVDFNPGSGTDEKTSAGSSDAFLTKINADGSYGWTKTIGGSGSDNGRSVGVDSAGNIYVAGPFQGTVDFNPGSGTDEKTSAGSTDIYVSRFKSDGSYDYTKVLGGTNSDDANSVSVDSADNVYIAGSFRTTVDFDPGVGTNNLTSAGGNDIFLTKLTQTTYQQITGLDPSLTAKTLSDTDATDNAIVNGTATTIRLSAADNTPLADVTTTFAADLDWSTVTAESNPTTVTAFVHNLTAADGTAGTYTLYVPKLTGHTRVGICPGAASLAAVTDECEGLYYLTEGEDDNLSTVTIDGTDYWAISGLTGTGGFSTEAAATSTGSDSDALADTGQNTSLLILSATTLLILALYISRRTCFS